MSSTEESKEFPERFRSFKLRQEPRFEMLENGPERELRDRSKLLSEAPHLAPAGREMVPLRLVDRSERASRESSGSRKEAMEWKSADRSIEERSMEETRSDLQETPMKLQGFFVGTQFWSRAALLMADLKPRRSCLASPGRAEVSVRTRRRKLKTGQRSMKR